MRLNVVASSRRLAGLKAFARTLLSICYDVSGNSSFSLEDLITDMYQLHDFIENERKYAVKAKRLRDWLDNELPHWQAELAMFDIALYRQLTVRLRHGSLSLRKESKEKFNRKCGTWLKLHRVAGLQNVSMQDPSIRSFVLVDSGDSADRLTARELGAISLASLVPAAYALLFESATGMRRHLHPVDPTPAASVGPQTLSLLRLQVADIATRVAELLDPPLKFGQIYGEPPVSETVLAVDLVRRAQIFCAVPCPEQLDLSLADKLGDSYVALMTEPKMLFEKAAYIELATTIVISELKRFCDSQNLMLTKGLTEDMPAGRIRQLKRALAPALKPEELKRVASLTMELVEARTGLRVACLLAKEFYAWPVQMKPIIGHILVIFLRLHDIATRNTLANRSHPSARDITSLCELQIISMIRELIPTTGTPMHNIEKILDNYLAFGHVRASDAFATAHHEQFFKCMKDHRDLISQLISEVNMQLLSSYDEQNKPRSHAVDQMVPPPIRVPEFQPVMSQPVPSQPETAAGAATSGSSNYVG